MRSGPPDDLLAGFISWEAKVASWRAGVLLQDDIPVSSGRITWSRSQKVPDALTMVVPRHHLGVDYLPGSDPDHPLARFGQMLAVSIITRSSLDGLEYETKLGMFPIHAWKLAGGRVEVTAKGILQRAAEARLTSPLAPRSSGTLTSEFRRLLPAGLVASIDASLTDRACPQSMEWAEDRIGALYEIADAWPARILPAGNGQIRLLPPIPATPEPIITLRDGDGGTLIDETTEDTREGAYNMVVARSSATDQPSQSPLQAIATTATGPMATDVYGEVPTFFSSPIMTKLSHLQAAAATRVESARRPSSTIPATILADPRIELDDPVRIQWDPHPTTGLYRWDELGYITQVDMPLTAGDGHMTVEVGIG